MPQNVSLNRDIGPSNNSNTDVVEIAFFSPLFAGEIFHMDFMAVVSRCDVQVCEVVITPEALVCEQKYIEHMLAHILDRL